MKVIYKRSRVIVIATYILIIEYTRLVLKSGIPHVGLQPTL